MMEVEIDHEGGSSQDPGYASAISVSQMKINSGDSSGKITCLRGPGGVCFTRRIFQGIKVPRLCTV